MKPLFPIRIKNRVGFTNLLAGIRSNTISEQELAELDVNVHIVQIGAGGTGGYVAAEVLRYIGALPPVLKERVWYTLVDGDAFEAKNLGRQLCTEDDLGVNKAEALINNLAPMLGAEGPNVSSYPHYITREEDLRNLYTSVGLTNVQARGKLSVAANCKTPKNFRNGAGDRFGTQTITIYLDCVDKTAPRAILHNMLEREYTEALAFEDYFRSICNRSLTYMNLWNEHREFFEYISTYEKEQYGEGVENPDIYVSLDLDEHGNIVQDWYKPKRDLHYKYSGIHLFDNMALYRQTPVYPETYIISSGNGKYTGQVYWGRYSRVLRYTRPIKYKDVYGDQEVSMLDCSTEEDIKKEFINKINMLENKPMWPLVAKYVDNHVITKRIMHALFMTNYTNLRCARNDKKILDGATKKEVANPVMESFENFVAAHISLPSPYVRHPELIDPQVDADEAALSCADRAAQNVQNINANKTAAQLVINYFNAIMSGIFPLEADDDQGHILATAGVKFDIRNNNVTPEFITVDYLNKYA